MTYCTIKHIVCLCFHLVILKSCIKGFDHSSVSLSSGWGLSALNLNKMRKNQDGVNIFRGRTNWCADFEFKRWMAA